MASKKSQPSWWIAVGILVVGLFSFLGKMQFGDVASQLSETVSSSSEQQSGNTTLPPSASADTIRMATFNIQVFGVSKMDEPKVVERLAQLVRQFDLVAIQEIRSVDQTVLPRFVEKVNEDGSDYRFQIGKRLGRTISKEQYAYVYRSSLLEPIENSTYTVDDPQDRLHREPYVSSFRVRSTSEGEPFTFTLMNMHTDPDEADWEVEQLAEFYEVVTKANPEEDDIILLGDLNVDDEGLAPLKQIPLLRSVAASSGPTNTRGNKQYDHIVVNHQHTLEYTGEAGVVNMQEYFEISEDEALDISDHRPVWAEFSTTEQAGPTRLASPFEERTIR